MSEVYITIFIYERHLVDYTFTVFQKYWLVKTMSPGFVEKWLEEIIGITATPILTLICKSYQPIILQLNLSRDIINLLVATI